MKRQKLLQIFFVQELRKEIVLCYFSAKNLWLSSNVTHCSFAGDGHILSCLYDTVGGDIMFA